MVTAPDAFAAARLENGPAEGPSLRTTKRFEKSTFPISRPMGGIRTSSTSDLTIPPKAAPMMIPTAMSTTFPRIAKFLNSFSMDGSPFSVRRTLEVHDERDPGEIRHFDAVFLSGIQAVPPLEEMGDS